MTLQPNKVHDMRITPYVVSKIPSPEDARRDQRGHRNPSPQSIMDKTFHGVYSRGPIFTTLLTIPI